MADQIDSLFSLSFIATPRPNTVTAMTQIVLRLTDGNAPIRGMKVAGRNLFSVYDFLWDTGAYVSQSAVKGAWLRLTQSEHKDEVVRFTNHIKFPGTGQKHTP